ncbi:MAG: Tetratricopeptide 4 [Frankiales bacterium]|nr:Tetratricopeptide 4 [Frankiales bacterium]
MARVPLPDDVDPRDLDSDTRKQLMSLSKDTADVVARHLVMAGRLMDEAPEQALAHARAARALAGRVGTVREANGLVAYMAGEWAEALSELRTARRLTGEPDHLAVMADCERALGHPDRALLVTEDPQVKGLGPATRVELLIVASGARRDMGQADAAVVSLQVAALEGPTRPWTARLRYAYADALLDAGREDEARQWFARAADVDEAGETDAEDRLLTLDGVVFDDLQEDGEDDQELLEDPPQPLIIDMSTFVTAASGSRVEPAAEPPPAPDHGVDRSGTTGLGFVAPPAAEPDDDLTLFD